MFDLNSKSLISFIYDKEHSQINKHVASFQLILENAIHNPS